MLKHDYWGKVRVTPCLAVDEGTAWVKHVPRICTCCGDSFTPLDVGALDDVSAMLVECDPDDIDYVVMHPDDAARWQHWVAVATPNRNYRVHRSTSSNSECGHDSEDKGGTGRAKSH